MNTMNGNDKRYFFEQVLHKQSRFNRLFLNLWRVTLHDTEAWIVNYKENFSHCIETFGNTLFRRYNIMNFSSSFKCKYLAGWAVCIIWRIHYQMAVLIVTQTPFVRLTDLKLLAFPWRSWKEYIFNKVIFTPVCVYNTKYFWSCESSSSEVVNEKGDRLWPSQLQTIVL